MRKHLSKLPKDSFFLAFIFTLLSLFLNGFELTRGVDMKLIKYFQDPTLFANDIYIQSITKTPYTFPFRVIAITSQIFPFLTLENLLFIIYLIVTFLILLILAEIVKTLFHSRRITLLFLFLFILDFRPIQFGPTTLHLMEGRPFLTPHLIARVFQFGSLLFLLKQRYLLAVILAGFAFNIHASTSLFLAIILAVFFLFNLNKIKTKSLFLWAIAFFLSSSPTWLAFFSAQNINFSLDEKGFMIARYLSRGLSTFLHFPLSSFVFTLITLSLVLIILKKSKTRIHRLPKIVFFSVFLMAMANLILVDLLKISFSLTFLFLKSSYYLDLFGLAYLTSYLVESWGNRKLPKSLILLVIPTMVFSLYRLFFYLALTMLLVELITLVSKKWDKLTRAWLPLFAIAILFISLLAHFLVPSILPQSLEERLAKEKPKIGQKIQTGTRQKEWENVQLWSNITPKNSLFLILVEDNHFNIFSERAIIRLAETSGNLLFDPLFSKTYIAQMETLGFNFEEMIQKNNVVEQKKRIYQSISPETIKDFAKEYDISYVIAYTSTNLNFKAPYENSFFKVYQIK